MVMVIMPVVMVVLMMPLVFSCCRGFPSFPFAPTYRYTAERAERRRQSAIREIPERRPTT